MRPLYLIDKLKRRLPVTNRYAWPVVGLVALVGIVVVIVASAAGTFVAVEPENGTIASPAQSVTLSGTSGGKALKFGAATPTPSPTPPPSGSCALPNYPDATCTGVPAGTNLTAYTGPSTITTAGTIIDSKNITTCLIIKASNVTIRKSKVACSGSVINNCPDDPVCPYTNMLIEDTEVSCNNTNGTGITTVAYTARRVNVHGCENVVYAQKDVTIEDSFIHDPIDYTPATDPHTDSIQVPETGSNVTVRHNKVYGNYVSPTSYGSSAMTAARTVTNILITNNVFAGGGYALYCPEEYLGYYGTNVRVIDNHFSTIFTPGVGGEPAPSAWTGCSNEAQVTGNVYHETGQPVAF